MIYLTMLPLLLCQTLYTYLINAEKLQINAGERRMGTQHYTIPWLMFCRAMYHMKDNSLSFPTPCLCRAPNSYTINFSTNICKQSSVF